LLCVALETSRRWAASIGLRYNRNLYTMYTDIFDDHWTTRLSYVCQYHSKSFTRCYT